MLGYALGRSWVGAVGIERYPGTIQALSRHYPGTIQALSRRWPSAVPSNIQRRHSGAHSLCRLLLTYIRELGGFSEGVAGKRSDSAGYARDMLGYAGICWEMRGRCARWALGGILASARTRWVGAGWELGRSCGHSSAVRATPALSDRCTKQHPARALGSSFAV